MSNKEMSFNIEFESLINQQNKQNQKNNVPGLHYKKIWPKIGKHPARWNEL